eukprot:6177620-Pleurochrysis_carterae.AAC.1
MIISHVFNIAYAALPTSFAIQTAGMAALATSAWCRIPWSVGVTARQRRRAPGSAPVAAYNAMGESFSETPVG